MILLPALIGGALAGGTAVGLLRAGLLGRPGIIGLLLIAIAGFWPLFAVAAQDDVQLLLHISLFVTFAAVALFSHRAGLAGLALALITHGVFDGILYSTDHVGPAWWPAFCAGYDVVLGISVLFALWKTK